MEKETLNIPSQLEIEDSLSLSQLGDLIDRNTPNGPLFQDPPGEWGGYFQSPINKMARTLDHAFTFDGQGSLIDRPVAKRALQEWLGLSDNDRDYQALDRWMGNGNPGDPAIFDRIKHQLSEETLKNHHLHNRPICRLARIDQLRYDPNYQAIYQLPPSHINLFNFNGKESNAKELSTFQRIRRNQRAYWGVSETFQSLVAMFDSDLGRHWEPTESDIARMGIRENTQVTKEFLRLQIAEEPEPLAPAEFSLYSPLRFWSPPPSFSRCVFHMLFWKSVITGEDLYKRPISGETVSQRCDNYYVIINWFNAAKYRIANYAELMNALLVIAEKLAARGQGRSLDGMEDLVLLNRDQTQLFYPRFFDPLGQDLPYRSSPLTLTIPLRGALPRGSSVWELALRYHKSPDRATQVSHLLSFIRDKVVEIILWSKYQMEIRSIGLIPVQYLYKIELDSSLDSSFEEVRRMYETWKEEGLKDDGSLERINQRVLDETCDLKINDKIQLIKVYGGNYRDIFARDEVRKSSRKIQWLEGSDQSPTPYYLTAGKDNE